MENLAGLSGQAVEQIEILLVGGAEPLNEFAADRAEDLDGGGGLETGQNANRGAGDAEEFAILQRQDIRRARAFIHEGNLAEKVADFELGEFHISIGRRGVNHRCAGEQKVKAMPLLAGLDYLRAFRKRRDICQADEGGQLLSAKAGK
jgi:hypothetical protein